MGSMINLLVGVGNVVMVFLCYDEYTKASTVFTHFLWAGLMFVGGATSMINLKKGLK